MPVNKAKGNMYGFVTGTWNTVKGECFHQCEYCYMNRYGQQRPVRFDKKELKTDLGSEEYLFVGSSCDMFAAGIPREWVLETLLHCSKFPGNAYLFQTKNPTNVLPYIEHLPKGSTICTTIETNRRYEEMGCAPAPSIRSDALQDMRQRSGLPGMITIEPVMDFDVLTLMKIVLSPLPVRINIGANTNPAHPVPEPRKEDLLRFIELIKPMSHVYLKKNLRRMLGPEYGRIDGVEREGDG